MMIGLIVDHTDDDDDDGGGGDGDDDDDVALKHLQLIFIICNCIFIRE